MTAIAVVTAIAVAAAIVVAEIWHMKFLDLFKSKKET